MTLYEITSILADGCNAIFQRNMRAGDEVPIEIVVDSGARVSPPYEGTGQPYETTTLYSLEDTFDFENALETRVNKVCQHILHESGLDICDMFRKLGPQETKQKLSSLLGSLTLLEHPLELFRHVYRVKTENSVVLLMGTYRLSLGEGSRCSDQLCLEYREKLREIDTPPVQPQPSLIDCPEKTLYSELISRIGAIMGTKRLPPHTYLPLSTQETPEAYTKLALLPPIETIQVFHGQTNPVIQPFGLLGAYYDQRVFLSQNYISKQPENQTNNPNMRNSTQL